MLKANKALNKAKINLIIKPNSVFLTTILFSLKQSWNNKIPTAATNGTELLINSDWFLTLTLHQRVALLAHESYHVCFQHMLRGVNKEKEKYNKAADYVINIMLKDAGFDLPPEGLVDSKYRNMSTEQVYVLLESKPEEKYDCDLLAITSNSDSDNDKTEQDKVMEIGNIIVKAITQSKMQGDDPGTVPGEIEVMIDELINPKLPWNQVLQNYINGYVKEDFSFRKPNRRFLPEFYLPSLYSEGLDHLAFAVDASYSVLDEEFAMYLSEIEHARETLKPKLTTIIDFDTKVKNVHKLSEDISVQDIVFQGRGGTDIKPPLKYFKQNKPTVLIIFTDGEFYPYEDDIDFPIIWVIIGNKGFTSNIGKVIHYEE